MELMTLKDKILIAQKGYQLLKQKRDTLIIELMTIVHTSTTLRDKLNKQISKSYTTLNATQSYHSIIELENTALSTHKTQSPTVELKNVMGVKLPTVNWLQKQRRLADRGWNPTSSSTKIDETAENFEKTLDIIMELAEKEITMKKLLIEIEKTKRRVNALDYIVLPWMQKTQNDITLKLDENERDDLITLKTVKKYLEQITINTSQI
jgi:V/A-type H+/Na+-transporting ATPase subunit D